MFPNLLFQDFNPQKLDLYPRYVCKVGWSRGCDYSLQDTCPDTVIGGKDS
jgi:hypothetical protein